MHRDIFKAPPHTPAHLFRAGAIYMITACIYQRLPLMRSDARKKQWIDTFFKAAEIYTWQVIAWVVLDEHYHVLVRAPLDSALDLPKFVGSYHKFTSRAWNEQERAPGRKVWWNYWDSCIQSSRDYLIRLNYIHWNPVKHGIAKQPESYAYSSYRAYITNQAEEIHRIEAEHPFEDVQDVAEA